MYPMALSLTAQERIKGMVEIRDCVRKLIEYQMEDYPDEDITISPNFDQLHYETLEGRVLFYWIDEPLTEYETSKLIIFP